MSTRTTDTGMTISTKGRDHRTYRKETITVKTLPDRRDIMVTRKIGHNSWVLFLSDEEANTVADALDDIIDYRERTET